MKPHLNESFGSMRSKSSPSWLRIGGWSPVSTPSENVQPTRKLASTFLPWADSGAVINTTSANATSPVTFLNMIDLHAWVTTRAAFKDRLALTCAWVVARRVSEFGSTAHTPKCPELVVRFDGPDAECQQPDAWSDARMCKLPAREGESVAGAAARD